MCMHMYFPHAIALYKVHVYLQCTCTCTWTYTYANTQCTNGYTCIYNSHSHTACACTRINCPLCSLPPTEFCVCVEAAGSSLPAQFAHLEQLEESFGRIVVLKLITDKHYQLPPTTTLTLEPFKSVHSLIVSVCTCTCMYVHVYVHVHVIHVYMT